MIEVGDLVRIKMSFSRQLIGKMALVIESRDAWNAKIQILETGEQDSYALSKLEKL
tara:strand:+ start:63 stop:230 length:168 start_codon:yes stop_codon:yes gene_type:complete